ncbi:MAG TPA: PP2C family protein-serine/threonine phosphatase, partial [Acidimicrobiales bacterium]|nr:PP2C family protein-serine/threonine phosphatase [Acidimicrobiales bacterium]
DICGRGPVAAAQTGRVRHSFRMSAWHGDSPVEILDWLDQALRTGGDGVLCTAAVAALERAADGTFELTCALGGHPPPVLCRADGSVEYFGEYGTLLGTDLTVHNVAVSTALGPDEAVFFYTDGVTDAPPPHQLSQSQLLGLVGEAWADLPDASVLADRVLAEADRTLGLDERTDDIALLVFRRT